MGSLGALIVLNVVGFAPVNVEKDLAGGLGLGLGPGLTWLRRIFHLAQPCQDGVGGPAGEMLC